MDILFFIIIVVIFIYQGSRISKLESHFKNGGKAPSPVPRPAIQTSTNSTPVASVETAKEIPSSPAHTEELSGKILGRLGIAAVVIGMAFFLKYAFDNNWVGPAGRIMIGLAIGIAVMGMGQWLRKKYLGYSDLLMGGGMAIVYLSIFASYGLYHLVDPFTAFFGMVVITAVGVIISIINATEALSVIALVGGFVTPFLIGSELLGPWIVFTYITILNAGILGILFYKKWPPLVLIGLIGTWIHFGLWLMNSYRSEFLIQTLLFILIQFLIFTAASTIRLIVEKAKANELDYVILAGTALSFVAACYYILMPEYKHFVSVGAVLVAGFYGTIALIAFKENPEDKSLNIFLPGLAVAFLTVAVPIEFSGPWIAAWWFIEALVLYVVASTSSSRGFQVMGVIVYILGLFDVLKYIYEYTQPSDYVIFWNGPFIMLVLATATAYVIAFVYYKYGSVSQEVQMRGIMAFIILGNVITLYALTTQVQIYYALSSTAASTSMSASQLENWSHTMVSILWVLYAALLTAIGFVRRYVVVRRMGLALFIITAFKVVIDVWSLGELYRIISFIVFGAMALVASFAYVKYKDRLKSVM